MGDLFKNGKTTKAKPHQMNLRSLLLKIHYYQNKQLQVKESQYLIPTYSWTFTPKPNWTYSVVIISHFQCTTLSTWLTNRCMNPSMWLTHQLEKDVGYKVFQFIHTMKIKKLLGYKTLLRTNIAVSSRERWTRTYVSDHSMLVTTITTSATTFALSVTTLKIISIYV